MIRGTDGMRSKQKDQEQEEGQETGANDQPAHRNESL